MPDSQDIIISIDRRLAQARKEIASLEAALTAMRKPSKAAKAAKATRTTRAARGNGAGSATAAASAATAARPAASAPSATAAAPANGTADATGAAPANGTGRARSRRTRRAPTRRRAHVVPAGKLVTLLGTSEGMSTADLADQTGGDRQQLLTLLRELEAAGQVRRSGERRRTRWHVITDEDRIAARVAELEGQRSRRTPSA